MFCPIIRLFLLLPFGLTMAYKAIVPRCSIFSLRPLSMKLPKVASTTDDFKMPRKPVSKDISLEEPLSVKIQPFLKALQEDYSTKLEDDLFVALKSVDYKSLNYRSLVYLVDAISKSRFMKLAFRDAFRDVYYKMFDAIFSVPYLSKVQLVLAVKSFFRCKYRLKQTDNIEHFLYHCKVLMFQMDDTQFPGFFVFYASLDIQFDWLPRDFSALLVERLVKTANVMDVRATSRVILCLGKLNFKKCLNKQLTETVLSMATKCMWEACDESEESEVENDSLINVIEDTLKGLEALGLDKERMDVKLTDYIKGAVMRLTQRITELDLISLLQSLGLLGFTWSSLPVVLQERLHLRVTESLPDIGTSFRFQRLLHGLSLMQLDIEDMPPPLQKIIEELSFNIN